METFPQKFMNMRLNKVTLFLKNLFRTYFCIFDPSHTFSKRESGENFVFQLLPRLTKILIYSVVIIGFTETCDAPIMDQ